MSADVRSRVRSDRARRFARCRDPQWLRAVPGFPDGCVHLAALEVRGVYAWFGMQLDLEVCESLLGHRWPRRRRLGRGRAFRSRSVHRARGTVIAHGCAISAIGFVRVNFVVSGGTTFVLSLGDADARARSDPAHGCVGQCPRATAPSLARLTLLLAAHRCAGTPGRGWAPGAARAISRCARRAAIRTRRPRRDQAVAIPAAGRGSTEADVRGFDRAAAFSPKHRSAGGRSTRLLLLRLGSATESCGPRRSRSARGGGATPRRR